MFGKHFASMYSGSLFGKPATVFAVWGYAISHMRPTHNGGPCHVELNPALLAATFATTVEEINAALLELEAPDPASRSSSEDGRRMILLGDRRSSGPMQYRVVNGDKYRALRDEEERRRYLTEKKREERAAKAVSTKSETVNLGQPRSTQAEAEAEAEETNRLVERPPQPEQKRKKPRPAAPAPGPRAELNWRVEQTWLAHLAQWREFFRSVNGAVPSPDPTLTEEIREAIREALLTYDGALLGPDQREEWRRQSKALAAGIGIFLDPWCTGQHKDNEATNGGKRYLEHWRPWKRQRGKGDPVDRFSELYFEVQSVAT